MAQQGVSDMAKYDEMSFGKAFAAARKELGKGKTFTWKGKSYTTNLKEEAAAPKKKSESVPVPPPRPSIAAMSFRDKPTSDTTQRSMAAKVIKKSKLPEDKKSSGRGEGSREALTRRMQSAIDRAASKATKEYTYSQWKNMTPAERRKAGLPESVIGGELGFKRFRSGITGKDYTMTGK
jgi:hypothetical protein